MVNVLEMDVDQLAVFFGVRAEQVQIVPAKVIEETMAGEASME
jgi:hypothetical protein